MKNKTKKGLLYYSVLILSIVSVVAITGILLNPIVRKSIFTNNNSLDAKNSDGSPLHSKSIKDNGDGTFTLSLNVTGESEPDVQPDKKANVVIVMDISGSMFEPASTDGMTSTSGNTVGRYINTSQTGLNLWRLYYYYNGDSEYPAGYYAEGQGPQPNTRHTNVYYPRSVESNGTINWSNGSNYTRYNFTNNDMKLDQTKTAVKNSIDTLLTQNNVANDMIEISFMTFSTYANYVSPTRATATGWTSGSKDSEAATALKDAIDSNTIPAGGTNWDLALYYAKDLANAKKTAQPTEDTYIVFFSDGNPTYHSGDASYTERTGALSHTHGGTPTKGDDGVRTGASDAAAAYYEGREIQRAGIKFFSIFAYGSDEGANYMKNLTSFANEGDISKASSVEEDGLFFQANDATSINDAFATIVSTITSSVGFSDVSISDGTTAVKTAHSGTGAIGSLLKVEESYKYYLSFPLKSDGTSDSQYITEITKVEGTENDYQLKSSNGNTYTVTRVPAYKTNDNGQVLDEELTNVFKFEWKDASNPLHQETPPAAEFKNNAVDWDLSKLNDSVLLNGITYEVTFDVYPSQVTLDIIADVKNGKIDIPEDGIVEDYIICDKTTKDCKLQTNTEATLTYTDTRTDKEDQTAKYDNPDPVSTGTVRALAVSKEWDNFGTTNGESSIKLYIDRDDSTKHYDVNLSAENEIPWQDSIYASIGIMTVNNGKVSIKDGAPGHDYSFSEDQNISYKWELTSPIVRPMMINGSITTLIKVDKPSGMTGEVYEDGNNTYYKLGDDDYYVVGSKDATLTATNHRRSHLDVTKVVTGADAPEGSLFEFNMTVTEGKGEKVYFSIQDENGNTVQNKSENPNSATTYISGSGVYPEIAILDPEKDSNIKNIGDWNESTKTITYTYGDKEYTVYAPGTKTNGYWDYYTGYYYMDSTKTATVLMEADWNLRFTNLSSETEYTIVETDNVYTEDGETPVEGFVFRTNVDQDNNESTNKSYTGTIDTPNKEFKLTYNNEYVLTHVDVKKIWDDNHNQDGKRILEDEDGNPIPVKFVLKQNGEEYQTITHDGTGTTIAATNDEEYWEYTFNNLNVYDTNGDEYTYTVEEVYNNSAYTTTSDGNATDGYVFTNTHTPETIDITVEKVWEDAEDQDGLRAAGANATITLYDGETATDYKLETNTNDSTTFTGLPVYRDGEKIVYSVQETETSYITGTDGPGTYAYEITGNVTDGFVVTNTHTPETINIKVSKVWEDEEDQDGLRAAGANATITLYDGETATSNTLTTNEDDEVTFTVDKYRKGSIGVPAQYSVQETETSYITGTDGPGTYAYEITGNVTDGFVVTNTHTPETINIKVSKVWEDEEDQDGLRAAGANATITLYDGETATSNTLTTNEDDEVTFTVDKYRKGSIGVPAQYSVQETETSYITGTDGPGTYAYEITGNVTDGFIVNY